MSRSTFAAKDRPGFHRRVAGRGAAVLAMIGLIAGTLVALSTPASAGGNMHVEVNMVVVGTPPPGTTFTVHYACSGAGPTGDLSFDAAGNPVPAASNFFNDGALGTTCTITETATGGATNVAFACEDNGVDASCASSGNAVTFDSLTNLSNNVTFTVTNTFVDAVPPPTIAPGAAEPGAATPAPAVVSAPRFTG